MIYKNKIFQILTGLLMLALVLSCILPLIMLLASSFSSEEQLLTKGYSFLPQGISLDAYAYLWKIKGSLPICFYLSGLYTDFSYQGQSARHDSAISSYEWFSCDYYENLLDQYNSR